MLFTALPMARGRVKGKDTDKAARIGTESVQ